MASLKVDRIKQALGAGVRSNLFRIVINKPPAIAIPDQDKLSLLVRSGQIPGTSLTPIEVPFRGARLKVPGDRTFDPWTATIYNDQGMVYRTFFESWNNGLKGFVSNVATEDPSDYYCQIDIYQLNQQGEEIGAAWSLIDAWPGDLTAIDLSSDNENSISDFSVTFQFQYWIHNVSTGAGVPENAGGGTDPVNAGDNT